MNCPDEVAEAVLSILETAILSMRVAASAGHAKYCAIEANHIHNLPALLRNYNRDSLKDYLELGREDYIEHMQGFAGNRPGAYELQWQRLKQFLQKQAV